ncbi:MAG: hypothetical protein AAFP99_01705 [Pseudomonadota bacterium]
MMIAKTVATMSAAAALFLGALLTVTAMMMAATPATAGENGHFCSAAEHGVALSASTKIADLQVSLD